MVSIHILTVRDVQLDNNWHSHSTDLSLWNCLHTEYWTCGPYKCSCVSHAETWSYIGNGNHLYYIQTPMYLLTICSQENKLVRQIFRPNKRRTHQDERLLHNAALNNLYFSPNTVKMIKKIRMRWIWKMEQAMHTKFWLENTEGTDYMRNLGRGEDIKLDFREKCPWRSEQRSSRFHYIFHVTCIMSYQTGRTPPQGNWWWRTNGFEHRSCQGKCPNDWPNWLLTSSIPQSMWSTDVFQIAHWLPDAWVDQGMNMCHRQKMSAAHNQRSWLQLQIPQHGTSPWKEI